MSDIKITMLGAPGAGKTCFLLGMYAVMREGVRGFTFSSENPDQDLDLSNRWDRLVGETGATRWPKPNDNNVLPYKFRFNYGFSKLLGFDWLDYRGGALADLSSEADVRELKQHATDSASIFLCVSGEYMANGHGATYVRYKAMIARMNQIFSDLAESGHKPSVAVVLTKYDHCGKNKQEMIDFVQGLFNPLFAEGTGWFVTICPVTLGVDLAKNPDAGMIDPKNLHLPVSFAIYSAFRQQMVSVDGEIRRREDRSRELSRSFFSRLFNQDEIKSSQRVQEELRRNREQIGRNLDLLLEELMGNVIIFDNGEEEFDV